MRQKPARLQRYSVIPQAVFVLAHNIICNYGGNVKKTKQENNIRKK